ncbi:hypothetical protein V5O48_000327 [Marasmius crinis-equi]|uniref:INO80 complex subunit B-like conserved region domain-containing protein n=1 Tax=Marasmius crinis-equi TaxID=585013 RepID=A0ABR3G1R4_9AGAR
MSFRIKLPPTKSIAEMSENFEQPSRRKQSKRTVLYSDDEDDMETQDPSSPPPMKRQRLDEETSYQDDFVNVEDEEDNDGYDEDARLAPSGRSKRRIVKPKRYLEEEEEMPVAAPAPSRGGNSNKNKRKKSRRAEDSDGESEDDKFELDEDDLAHDLGTLNDDDEDEFEDEPKRSSKSKGKGNAARGPKGKGREAASSKKTKPPRPSLNVTTSPLVDVEDQSYPSPATSAPSTSQNVAASSAAPKENGSPPAKKRKLPSIKKNKPSTAGTPVAATKSMKAMIANKPPNAEDTDLAKTLTPKAAVPPASADLDLRNNNVYAELFNRPGASNVRAGINRREKEEQRRKELDKMRDEARAKRTAEGRGSFALQAQMDKILRFEERLRRSNTPALYPNILGAKMREAYDIEKKRRSREPPRDVARKEQDLEEGEMA